jgi:hypothetical protein
MAISIICGWSRVTICVIRRVEKDNYSSVLCLDYIELHICGDCQKLNAYVYVSSSPKGRPHW